MVVADTGCLRSVPARWLYAKSVYYGLRLVAIPCSMGSMRYLCYCCTRGKYETLVLLEDASVNLERRARFQGWLEAHATVVRFTWNRLPTTASYFQTSVWRVVHGARRAKVSRLLPGPHFSPLAHCMLVTTARQSSCAECQAAVRSCFQVAA